MSIDAPPAPAPESTPPAWVVPLLGRFDRLLAALEAAPRPAPPAGEWLSAAELAEWLGVSARSVRTWELTGKLPPPVRVGRLKKWNRRAVEARLSADN